MKSHMITGSKLECMGTQSRKQTRSAGHEWRSEIQNGITEVQEGWKLAEVHKEVRGADTQEC